MVMRRTSPGPAVPSLPARARAGRRYLMTREPRGYDGGGRRGRRSSPRSRLASSGRSSPSGSPRSSSFGATSPATSCPIAEHCTGPRSSSCLAAPRPRPGLLTLVCAQCGGEWHLRWRPAVIERLSKVIEPTPLPPRRAHRLRGSIPAPADTATTTCPAGRARPTARPRGAPVGAARTLERQLHRSRRGRLCMARAARDQRGLGPAAQLIVFSNPGRVTRQAAAWR
jgi:hypothetical protein